MSEVKRLVDLTPADRGHIVNMGLRNEWSVDGTLLGFGIEQEYAENTTLTDPVPVREPTYAYVTVNISGWENVFDYETAEQITVLVE